MKTFARRTLQTVAALALVAPAAWSQTPIVVGIELGANFANVAGDSLNDVADTRFAGILGGFVRLGLNDKLSLEPHLTFSSQGFKMVTGDPNVTGALRLNYLQVPVLLRLSLSSGPSARPYLIAGPSFGVKAGCSVKVKSDGFSATADCGDSDMNIKSTDISGMLGAGVDFNKWSASIRWMQSFSSISDVSGIDVKNRVLSISVARMFRLGM